MNVRIDKRLNLTVPIYSDPEDCAACKGAGAIDGKRCQPCDGTGKQPEHVVAYVHSVPLGEEVVDRYFMLLGRTYNAIFSQGLGFAAGPGHAMRVLRHIAVELGVWGDDPKAQTVGAQRGLVEEIRRLTMVATLTKDGWRDLPWAVAVDQGAITAQDRAEVENAIAFFIAASATLNRANLQGVLEAAGSIWGAQTSSSSFTELMSSLRTSTGTGSTGAKAPAAASGGSAPANATVGGQPRSVPV